MTQVYNHLVALLVIVFITLSSLQYKATQHEDSQLSELSKQVKCSNEYNDLPRSIRVVC